ncbi:MAG TPA: hypothetical protein VGQ00_01765 [Candidatus Norongarragalinales archaeon]|jgi:hypothetical protein|nr:hypothetical protein [Candidatus Norongarragalinales archaeon]
MNLDAKGWFAVILILFFIASSMFALFSAPSFVPQATPTPQATTQPSFQALAASKGEVAAFTQELLLSRCATNDTTTLTEQLRQQPGIEGAISLGNGIYRIALTPNATKNQAQFQNTLANVNATLAGQCDNATYARIGLINLNATTLILANPNNKTQSVTVSKRQLVQIPALYDCFEKTCGLRTITLTSTKTNETINIGIVGTINQGQITELVFAQVYQTNETETTPTTNNTTTTANNS